MPLPAGLLAALATAEAVTSVIGTGADYASLAFTVADHVKAQEGLKYNSLVFKVRDPAPPATPAPATPSRQPASAASLGQPGGKSAATPPSQPRMPKLDQGIVLPILNIRGSGAVADFAVKLYFLDNPAGGQDVFHVVHLSDFLGFATEMGDQAEVEFSGQEAEDGYLLSVKGIVNELFSGFFHFWCDYLVRPRPSGSVTRPAPIQTMGGNLLGQGGRLTRTDQAFTIEF